MNSDDQHVAERVWSRDDPLGNIEVRRGGAVSVNSWVYGAESPKVTAKVNVIDPDDLRERADALREAADVAESYQQAYVGGDAGAE